MPRISQRLPRKTPNLPRLASSRRASCIEANSRRSGRVSPINGDLLGLGPITLFSGTHDILNSDAKRFVPLAKKAGVSIDYHEAPGMLHEYPLFPIPEAKQARQAIAEALDMTRLLSAASSWRRRPDSYTTARRGSVRRIAIAIRARQPRRPFGLARAVNVLT